MSDKGRIIAGLAIFLVLATFPIWHTLGAGGDASAPELELPKDSSQCVENTEYMTAYHMDLLDQWRNAVVREGGKDYTSKTSGERYEMSLTKTCMGCHGNREAFCVRCHNFANVEPRCWECHVESRGN